MSEFIITNGKTEKLDFDNGHSDNATLQGNTEGVEFSIGAYVEVADELLSDPHRIDQVEGLILDALRQATKKNPSLRFVVTVSHGEDVDPDELVPW